MDGVIEGGWSFVWAAYGVTWAGLGLYAWSLRMRRRALGAAEAGAGTGVDGAAEALGESGGAGARVGMGGGMRAGGGGESLTGNGGETRTGSGEQEERLR